MSDETVFDLCESAVRTYCRDFPGVFRKATNAIVEDSEGRSYVDFLAGAGALNYGHNNPRIRERVLAYLHDGGIVHSLDLHTEAKARFLERFRDVILTPRNLSYKVQFTGPTGTNAVEASLKLARKVTGRSVVAAFTCGFHGVTLGSLAATANPGHRAAAGVPLQHLVRLPYDGFLGPEVDTIEYARRLLGARGSGFDPVAAFIVETVQGEGGLNVATADWLRRLQALCRELEALLIVDDIQAGCGRTGTFFSFEEAGIVPDIVCLSKSIGGMGLPMAINLLRPEIDRWRPGEHNGTFRGNNLAFVAATAALDFWDGDSFAEDVRGKAKQLDDRLQALRETIGADAVDLRGLGMMRGIAFDDGAAARRASLAAFRRGVIAETCGPDNAVLKLLPPLTIERATLATGLDQIEAAVAEALESNGLAVAE